MSRTVSIVEFTSTVIGGDVMISLIESSGDLPALSALFFKSESVTIPTTFSSSRIPNELISNSTILVAPSLIVDSWSTDMSRLVINRLIGIVSLSVGAFLFVIVFRNLNSKFLYQVVHYFSYCLIFIQIFNFLSISFFNLCYRILLNRSYSINFLNISLRISKISFLAIMKTPNMFFFITECQQIMKDHHGTVFFVNTKHARYKMNTIKDSFQAFFFRSFDVGPNATVNNTGLPGKPY